MTVGAAGTSTTTTGAAAGTGPDALALLSTGAGRGEDAATFTTGCGRVATTVACAILTLATVAFSTPFRAVRRSLGIPLKTSVILVENATPSTRHMRPTARVISTWVSSASMGYLR